MTNHLVFMFRHFQLGIKGINRIIIFSQEYFFVTKILQEYLFSFYLILSSFNLYVLDSINTFKCGYPVSPLLFIIDILLLVSCLFIFYCCIYLFDSLFIMTDLNIIRVIPLYEKSKKWSGKFLAKARRYGFKDLLLGKVKIPRTDVDNDMESEE
jgi:hypothetical protein